MGWFWGASDSGKPKPSSENPLRNLDPGLRDFLEKESPVKYSSSNPPAPPETVSSPIPPPERQSPSQQSTESRTEDGPKVPTQSLFKDGRYAYLWSTYTPQTDVESSVKTDAEKISDVLEGYKQRKAEIGRAALENCALEQWDVNECFRSGGWASRMTMCRAENRKLERCYLMQAKFLKALGYLSTYDRPPEVDEKIQMHADTLYHRMLDQEAAIEAAKAEGRPIPSFSPIIASVPNAAKIVDPKPNPDAKEYLPSDLPLPVQAQLKKRLDGLSDKEREVEEEAIKAELRGGEQIGRQLGSIFEKQENEKKIRKEQGRETMGDKMSSIFGFR